MKYRRKSALRRVENEMGAAPQRHPQRIDNMQTTQPLPLGQPQLSFIREGHVKFTPAQANLVLRFCRYERQRNESRAKSHIATLAEYMRRGQWLEKSQLDFARINGQIIMVNGHHRMRAQIDSARDILWNIAIHDCATEEEVRGLYYRFDTTLRKRSGSNIVSGVGFAEGAGLSQEMGTKLFNAAPIIARGFSVGNNTGNVAANVSANMIDNRIEVCQQYIEQAAIYSGIIKGSPLRRKLLSASVLAVAMVTLKAAPEKADEFWRGVAADDGLKRGDPRKAYIMDLLTRQGNRGLQAALAMAAARAWQAYVDGRDLKHLKVTGSPIRIACTEYTVR